MSMLRTMARDLSRVCPYYRRGEKCRSGCWQEPYCVTSEPLHGWPWTRLMGQAQVIRRCNGILSTLDGQADCGRTDMRHLAHTFRDES